MSSKNSVVSIFPNQDQAEAAIKALKAGGISLKNLSLVGRGVHTEEHVISYYNAGDRMLAWGGNGAFWGGIWGLLFGSAFFWVPGVGPLMLAGPIVAWILGALEGALVVGGLSALGAALFSIGIPNNSILEYEPRSRPSSSSWLSTERTKTSARPSGSCVERRRPRQRSTWHQPLRRRRSADVGLQTCS